MSQINGRISQIIGPVIDVYFDTKGENPEKVLPKIHDALRVKRPNGQDLIIEVQQHRRGHCTLCGHGQYGWFAT